MKNAGDNKLQQAPASFFQANTAMPQPVPINPLYVMYPEALPKPPQKRRKLLGTGDKNGGEKLRVFSRLKGFKAKESLVWAEITRRFGSEIKHGELLSIAEIVAANAGVQLDRDAKRRKSVLIKWFEENWYQISPYLNYVILEDKKSQNNMISMQNYQFQNSNINGFNNNNVNNNGFNNVNHNTFNNVNHNVFNNNNVNNNGFNNNVNQNGFNNNVINNGFNNNVNNQQKMVASNMANYGQNFFQNNSMWQNNVNNNNSQFSGNKTVSNGGVNNNMNNNKIAQNIVNSIQIQNWMQMQNQMNQIQNNFQSQLPLQQKKNSK